MAGGDHPGLPHQHIMDATDLYNSYASDPGGRHAWRLSRVALRLAFVFVVTTGSCAALETSAARAQDSPVTSSGTPGAGGVRYLSPSQSGGTAPGDASRKRNKRATAPTIAAFSLVSNSLYDEGRPLKLRYLINARSRTVRVRMVVRTSAGQFVRTVSLGRHRSNVSGTAELTRAQLGVTTPGEYKLRLSAVDRNGRHAVRAARVPVWLSFSYSDHRFPLTGPFSFGGADSRFGAGRPDHIHQGQDLSAAEGTPVVAPFSGTVTWVKYQADGAGWYVVVDGLDGRDYVFMHLKVGSIEVKIGDAVSTGRLLARVGSTGSSSGPHLHFEIWTGGAWQFGGKPIDPRPLLDQWYAAAPGGATATD